MTKTNNNLVTWFVFAAILFVIELLIFSFSLGSTGESPVLRKEILLLIPGPLSLVLFGLFSKKPSLPLLIMASALGVFFMFEVFWIIFDFARA